jgi:hypothetical protein
MAARQKGRKTYETRLLLNQREFAQQIGRSVPIARELMNRPGFPCVTVGGHRLVVVSALDGWFQQQAEKERDGK